MYNWEYSRPMAIEAYNKVKDNWMYVTAYTVGKDLHLVEWRKQDSTRGQFT